MHHFAQFLAYTSFGVFSAAAVTAGYLQAELMTMAAATHKLQQELPGAYGNNILLRYFRRLRFKFVAVAIAAASVTVVTFAFKK